MTGTTGRRESWHRAVRVVALLVMTMALVVVLPVSVDASSSQQRRPTTTYLVQMALDPAVSYDGGVAGLSPTEPAAGAEIDPRTARVVEYVDHLETRHDAALDRVGGAEKLYDYAYSFDGFAAELTRGQAAELAAQPGVVSVTKDRLYSTETSSTPSFLGLDERHGLWDQLDGPTGNAHRDGAGEDIVIGVVDSGISPDAKSFSDRDDRGRLAYDRLRGFDGTCETEQTVGDNSWDDDTCNNKIVAARHFNAGWGGDEGLDEQRPWEFLSPRDYNGHGTHTASTAGGNHGVVPHLAKSLGTISGIAPRARIAAYKALWSTKDGSTAQGYGSDLLAAIDQAVADGVDVINYSVSGTSTDFLDPLEIAYLYAADAGIFVAAAGGNSGPATRTVAHPSPWLTTVAAGTHSRSTRGAVVLGNGETYTGASLAHRVGPAPLIVGTDAAAEGAESWQAALCYPASANEGEPVLDPELVAGKIVVCEEGNIAHWAKSRAVKDAGGVGMILTHFFDSPLNAYAHFVPTVDIATADRTAIEEYADIDGATATIKRATISHDASAPHTASFSSRGPLAAGAGNLLKPDVIAPGKDILAAVAPRGSNGLRFNILSGTSMAAPHVAGIAALLRDRHPDWSPMTIKSALMTTGYDLRDSDGTVPDVIFQQGAGHIQPNDAADPGLVYDSDIDDWLAFLCGTTDGVGPVICDKLVREGYSLDPSDLNQASIAIGSMTGPRTVTREVTNVGRHRSTYEAEIDGLDGIDVSVEPSRLKLRPGQTKSFTVTIAPDTAEPNRYYGGRLTWTDGDHTVRSPIVVRLARPPSTGWTVDTMAGGPTFDAATQTGYIQPELPIRPGDTAGDGVGVGAVLRFGGDAGHGKRVVRWDADGWAELGDLGADPDGNLQSYVFATAPDGTTVGNAGVWADDGTNLGNRPVRWDADSTTAVELDGLGTSAEGRSFGAANAINPDGAIAGEVDKYAADGTNLGRRAVRWDAGQATVTELGNLGTGTDGQTNTWTRAINADGDIVGYGPKRDESGGPLGMRAIRWDAGQTAATELGVLGTDDSGSTYAQAYDINDGGLTVGETTQFVDGEARGALAVRWDADGTAATDLGALGADQRGFASSAAYAVNNAGTIAGTSTAYADDGTSLGTRAVQWAPGSTEPTELDQLEVGTGGQAQSLAFDIDDDGLVVGLAHAYSEEGPGTTGDRAVLWTPDGQIVDLTSLLPADSGWTLTRAMSISDSGWLTGVGLYDPDGAGDTGAYFRLFLMHLTPAQTR